MRSTIIFLLIISSVFSVSNEIIYEKYILADSKIEFINTLIPESYEALYFKVLHELQTQQYLSKDGMKALSKLYDQDSSGQHEGYVLHRLDFLRILKDLDQSANTTSEKHQKALKDIKHYFSTIDFNANFSSQAPNQGTNSSSDSNQSQLLNSVFDNNLANLENPLEFSCTNYYDFSLIPSQYLCEINTKKLLSDAASSPDYTKILKEFLQTTPCLHQVEDAPAIYKILFQRDVSIIHYYAQILDRFSLNQLNQLGVLMKTEIFSTYEFQLAIMKKLFYKDLQRFTAKSLSELTQEEKFDKKKEYQKVYDWCQNNLPKKFNFIASLLHQELALLNIELEIYDQNFLISFLNNPPQFIQIFNTQMISKFQGDNEFRWRRFDWGGMFTFESLNQEVKIIEKYLLELFRTADSIHPFDTYFSNDYLERLFYKSKILSGQQKYISKASTIMTKTELNQLIDMRSITILENNQRYVKDQEKVKLQVETKNIQNLILNIFEIKTENYYLAKKANFDNQINLDGLVPIHSKSFNFSDPANQVVRREFELDLISNTKRGIFVAEFSGNSISSRAVFKKGYLTIVQTPTIAGHLIVIVDENQNICKPSANIKTGIWLQEQFYNANDNGQIIIPYQKTKESFQIITVHDEFAEISQVTLLTEEYQFKGTYIYNQESFLQGSKAKVLVHTSLSLNGVTSTMSLIKDQLIKVIVKNHQDIPTILEFRDIKFDPQNYVELEIPIQTIVKSIEIECSGVIHKMDGTSQNLLYTDVLFVQLHEQPANQIFGLYLEKNLQSGYLLSVLDKTGLPLKQIQVDFQFTQKKISKVFQISLQTDENGRITLGSLKNVIFITAKVNSFQGFPRIDQTWNILKSNKIDLPDEVAIAEDEIIEIPIPEEVSLSRKQIIFYSIGGIDGQEFIYEDLFDRLKQNGNFIQINNLKEGIYILKLLGDLKTIKIRVYKGQYWIENQSYLVAKNVFIPVQREKGKFISIKEARMNRQNATTASIVVQLNLPQDLTLAERNKLRVHLIGYHFISPEQEQFIQSLRNHRIFQNLEKIEPKSTLASFLSNKKISDEISYVQQRKTEQKRIGNTLEKPCVLLKRTANQDTSFEKEKLDQGSDYVRTSSFMGANQFYDSMKMNSFGKDYSFRQFKGQIDSFLNFLSQPSHLSSNNLVNEDGQAIINWDYHGSFQVIVTSDNLAITDSFQTNEGTQSFQNLRHQSSMKPNELYIENLTSGKLLKSNKLKISSDSQTAIIGSLSELYDIQTALMKTGRSTDEYLGKSYKIWSFLKEWMSLTDKQKLENYNEYASHELNIFIYFKDQIFFKSIVAPFIKNKLDKQFIDFFLLNEIKEIIDFASSERIAELNILEKSLLVLSLVKNNQYRLADRIVTSIENNYKIQSKNNDLKKKLFLTIIQSSGKDAIVEEQERGIPTSFGEGEEVIEKRNFIKKSRKYAPDRSAGRFSDTAAFLLIDDDFLMNQRNEYQQGYKKLDNTVEYIERNYYGDKNIKNYSQLITVNQFWVDLSQYALKNGNLDNFVSENFIFAFNNHVEAIAVLAVMDISFQTRDNYDIRSYLERKIEITAKNNILYFQKELVKTTEISKVTEIFELFYSIFNFLPLIVFIKANLSIIQTFFDPLDKFTTMKDDPTVQIEKEVEEFVINKIYGTKVIITNMSIANLNLQILAEIPSGSIPVNSFEYTKSIEVNVNSYQTVNAMELYFYFPLPGVFNIYRSNASRNRKIIAQAPEIPSFVVKASAELKKMETLSDILNYGSKEDILKFAKTQNLQDNSVFSISQIYRILKADKDFFISFLDILREQGLFIVNVWELSLHHSYTKGILELLGNAKYREDRLIQKYQKIYEFQGSQLKVDNFLPLEYHPLLTSRAHSFMNQKSKIQNVQFMKAYSEYLEYITHVAHPTGRHYLQLCYYLLLQERIDEAIMIFNRIDNVALEGEASLQRDYLSAYLDIYTGDPHFKIAREISKKYADYPVISWRNLFVNLSLQLAEYDGSQLEDQDGISDAELSTNLKNAEKLQQATIEIQGNNQLIVHYQNIEKVEIHFYQLDLEILFSTQPFLQGKHDSNEFTFVKSNESIKLNFLKSSTLEKKIIDIPANLAKRNLFIQLVSDAGVQNLSFFSSSLKVQYLDKLGQVKITDESNIPLQKVYVKCFAKYKDDSVSFFRDGYTDLRGRFEYSLSSASDINQVTQFAIFIDSETHGSVIKELPPPSALSRMDKTLNIPTGK